MLCKSQIPLFGIRTKLHLRCISCVFLFALCLKWFLICSTRTVFIVVIVLYALDRARFLNQEVRLAERVSWNIKSHTVDAVLMHHEIYNSTSAERGVQKNIKIQYLKGGTEVYLKSGALFRHHAYYFIVCLYLLPLTDPSLPSVVMRAGICCDPHWLIDFLSSLSPSLKKSTNPHVYSRQKERICPENMPPATLTPRGHGNIHRGEHYWFRVPYYVPSHSFSLLREWALTYMQKIKQVLPNWIQMGNFE